MKTRRLTNKLSNRKSVVTLPRQVAKVGRNEPCPCGSGKKYKHCHESEGEAYLTKLAQEEARRRYLESRKSGEEERLPWYRRLFAGFGG